MATRSIPVFQVITDYTQAQEDTLAASLSSVSGAVAIFNTTLNQTRIWDGTVFTSISNVIGNVLGTPASGNLANCTFPTLNQNTTGTANVAGGTVGAIPYQSGANTTTILAATATANKILCSGASAAPTWSTPTFPNASATNLKWMRSDGTNWVASTATLAEGAVTSGKVLVSDGTNWIASTPTFPNASATSRKITISDGTNWVASTETWATPGSAGNMLVSDGTNWTASNTRSNWTTFVVSGSDVTTTGQSLVDITGLISGTLAASTLYEIEAYLYVSTSAVTTGTQYAVHGGGSGNAATVLALMDGTTTTNAVASVTLSAPDAAQGTFLTTSSTSGVIRIHGFVLTRSTGTPTISIQHLKITSGTSTVKIGSKFMLRLAN